MRCSPMTKSSLSAAALVPRSSACKRHERRRRSTRLDLIYQRGRDLGNRSAVPPFKLKSALANRVLHCRGPAPPAVQAVPTSAPTVRDVPGSAPDLPALLSGAPRRRELSYLEGGREGGQLRTVAPGPTCT